MTDRRGNLRSRPNTEI